MGDDNSGNTNRVTQLLMRIANRTSNSIEDALNIISLIMAPMGIITIPGIITQF